MGQPSLLLCSFACGVVQEGTMQLTCWALAPLSNKFLCETGRFSYRGNPCRSPQSALSLSFPFSQPRPRGLLLCCGFSLTACLPGLDPTSLVGLIDCFFISLVVGVTCSLIFWQFWLFIVFRLVLPSCWLCEEVKGFYLCFHLGRNSSTYKF